MAKTEKQKIGDLGEEIACKFLMKHDFKIKDRNYRKKWGEIDIIATKNNVIHFIEVKTVSHITNREEGNNYLPEENVHPWKRQRLSKAIRTYVLDHNVSDETEWQIDIIAIFLDFSTRKAKIRMTENIIL